MLRVQRSKISSHWSRRASEGRGELPLLQKIFKAPRKDTVGSSPGKMKVTTGCASQIIYALQPHSAMARAKCSSPRQSSLLHPVPAAVPGTQHRSFIRANPTWPNWSQRQNRGTREDKAQGSTPRAVGSLPVSPFSPGPADPQSTYSRCPSSPFCSAFGECSRGTLPVPSREKRHRIKHPSLACSKPAFGTKGKNAWEEFTGRGTILKEAQVSDKI